MGTFPTGNIPNGEHSQWETFPTEVNRAALAFEVKPCQMLTNGYGGPMEVK